MSDQKTTDEKIEKKAKARQAVQVSTQLLAKVRKLAKTRDIPVSAAVDHCVSVGLTRIQALKNYTSKRVRA